MGVDALPQKATCTWEGRRQRFAGTVNAERDTFWQSYVGNKFGLLSDAQGRVDEKEGSGLSFDGDISNHIAFMGGSVVDARGTLRLPASMQAHRGSPEVSEGCVTGVWKNNKLAQGEGEFTMKDGTRYKGSLGPEGLMHGQGTLYWAGGATYQGTFDGGCLQDQGTLTWPGSEQLSGRFFRTPTWQQGGHRATCDVSLGHNAGVRFSFDATGQPDASTLIKLGA